MMHRLARIHNVTDDRQLTQHCSISATVDTVGVLKTVCGDGKDNV